MESDSPPSPKLIWVRPNIQEFFNSATPEENIDLWTIFFSLLYDPNPDNVNKFEADYFPYTGMGVREYFDRTFMIIYREDDNHDVHILRIYRLGDIQRRNPRRR